MSEWYEPKGDDVTIDLLRKQVDIYVKSNHQGNVYVSLNFNQIANIYDTIKGRLDEEETQQTPEEKEQSRL